MQGDRYPRIKMLLLSVIVVFYSNLWCNLWESKIRFLIYRIAILLDYCFALAGLAGKQKTARHNLVRFLSLSNELH